MIKKSSQNDRRVVVTGLGVVSSLGIGWEEFWKNLMAGKSGISKITSFDTSQYDRHYAGEVRGFEAGKFISSSNIKQLGRASQFAIAATKLAIKDAGIRVEDLKKKCAGVCIGTTMGESQVIEQIVKHTFINMEKLTKMRALIYPANSISVNVARYFKLTGQNVIFANACAAGNYAIGRAFDLIKSGKVDIMIAGGADALSRIAFTGFRRIYAMAPEKCQPFDKNRQGMMLGEGAGIVILESLANAKKRKAKIYAEVLGYGLSCDAYHMTEAAIQGIQNSIEKSLRNSGIKKENVDYISAHGTGTKENDLAECQALNRVFGGFLKKTPVSSIKSMLGHTMGAAAAFETIACCLAVKNNKIPPTINLETQDPECKIDSVPNKGKEHQVNIALNSSQAFGGNNACVVVRKLAIK